MALANYVCLYGWTPGWERQGRSRSRHANGSRNRAAGTRNRTRHPRMLAKHIRHQQRIHGGGVMAHT